MTKTRPLISVIMSVYNEEAFLKEAIDSILRQTVQNYELIIVDDCSSDGTGEILDGYTTDSRIHIIKNKENRGLTANLNRALEKASGIYIARMDGDDIAHKDRFEKELKYLESHPELQLISCRTETFGNEQLCSDIQGDPEYLRCRMLVRPVLAHPGFMARGEVFRELGFRYDESFRQAQDYELAARLSRTYAIGICPEVLLSYRAHKGQVSQKAGGRQFENADRVRERLLQELDIVLNQDEWNDYHQLVLETPTEDPAQMKRVVMLLDRIVDSNEEKHIYDPGILKKTLGIVMADWMIRTKSRKVYRCAGEILHGDKIYLYAYRQEWCRVLRRKVLHRS